MKWTADGQKICIAYEDGAVIMGSVEGNRIWGKDLPHQLSHLEWSPDSKVIVFGTLVGDIHIYDGNGNHLSQMAVKCLKDFRGVNKNLACLVWYSGGRVKGLTTDDFAAPSLCVAYENGRIQLMKHENDENPILIDTGMTVSTASWNNTGSILAISGSQPNKGGVVQFYTSLGVHMRTLTVPDSESVSSVSWEGSGLRICLSVNSIIYFANIKPDYK